MTLSRLSVSAPRCPPRPRLAAPAGCSCIGARMRQAAPWPHQPLARDTWPGNCWAGRRPRAWSCSARTGYCLRSPRRCWSGRWPEEMTEHLGYEKHDPAGRGSGNSRNGTTGKTLLTDVGAVDLQVPRDRNGSFDPKIVHKGQTRLEGVQRPHHRVVCARDDHPRYPRAPAGDVPGRGLCRPDLKGHRRRGREARGVVGLAAGSGLAGGVYRRADGEDPRRGGHQPGCLPGDRHRLRREQAGPGPVDRPDDWRVRQVLALGPLGAEKPRCGRRVHRVLRRAAGLGGGTDASVSGRDDRRRVDHAAS